MTSFIQRLYCPHSSVSARETLNFYDESEPGLLSDEDREYLKLLIRRKTTEAPKGATSSSRLARRSACCAR